MLNEYIKFLWCHGMFFGLRYFSIRTLNLLTEVKPNFAISIVIESSKNG